MPSVSLLIDPPTADVLVSSMLADYFRGTMLTRPVQIVATVIAGTVQLGVQSWWVFPSIHLRKLVDEVRILGCLPTFRKIIVPFLRPFSQCDVLSRDICDRNQKNKLVWSPLRVVPFTDHLPFSFTCASTQVFGTASIIVCILKPNLELSVSTLCSGAWLAQVCNLQRGRFTSKS